MNPITRRNLLLGSTIVVGGAVMSRSAAAKLLTPKATEGPFYPSAKMRLADVDNDLVKVAGMVKQAGGDIIRLTGRVISRGGEPLVGHRIEIWQCDVNGKYLHTGDDRPFAYDNGFQGFGHDITDSDGTYVFRTIKPTRYPGRTPHIHVKVCTDTLELLTTQFYIADNPDNEADSLFRKMSDEQARSVSMVFTEQVDGLETIVDVVI